MTKYNVIIDGLLGVYEKDIEIKESISYKTGGNVDLYALPKSIDDLKILIDRCAKFSIDYFILGTGSNILVSDKGYRGVFINLKHCCSELSVLNDNLMYVSSGIILQDAINKSIACGIGDLSNLSGIPGTIGGALFMNAGAFGTEISDFVHYVDVLCPKNGIQKICNDECGFLYRKASELEGKIILGTMLKLNNFSIKDMDRNKNMILSKREEKQPLDFPSCGSVFKRPVGSFAGTLIEGCGLKGRELRGAKISNKHANFILNYKQAKSQDIYDLIKITQKGVFDRYGIELQCEVKFVGF